MFLTSSAGIVGSSHQVAQNEFVSPGTEGQLSQSARAERTEHTKYGKTPSTASSMHMEAMEAMEARNSRSRWTHMQSLSSHSLRNLRNGSRFSANKVLERTPLMQAAMAGVISDVEELLTSLTSHLDLQDDMGMTALMWAACSAVYPPSKPQSFIGVMQMLLDAKASVNMEDDNGVSALMHTLSGRLGILNDPLQQQEVEDCRLRTIKLLLERRRADSTRLNTFDHRMPVHDLLSVIMCHRAARIRKARATQGASNHPIQFRGHMQQALHCTCDCTVLSFQESGVFGRLRPCPPFSYGAFAT